jgi:hypothetical protein
LVCFKDGSEVKTMMVAVKVVVAVKKVGMVAKQTEALQ